MSEAAEPDQGVSVTVPPSYTEHPKVAPYAKWQKPVVGVHSPHQRGSKTMRIYIVARDALGGPEAVRFFVDGDRVAILPASDDHPHSYPLWEGDVAITWMKYELESGLPQNGVYELERDGDLWIVDFDKEPIEE